MTRFVSLDDEDDDLDEDDDDFDEDDEEGIDDEDEDDDEPETWQVGRRPSSPKGWPRLDFGPRSA